MVKKNKKALGFSTIIGPFFLIFSALIFIMYINPTNQIPEKVDFGETIKSIDIINAKIPAEDFFKKEELKTIIDKAKFEFINNVISQNSFNRKETKVGDPLVTCNVQGLELWYNQKNEDENIILNSQTPKVESEDVATQQTTQTTDKYSNCIPNVGENLEQKLKKYLQEVIENEISFALKAQNIDKTPVVEVQYDPQTSQVKINIKTYYKQSSKLSKATVELEYEDSFSLGSYPQLIESTQKAILNIPTELKNNIPSCLEKNKYDESYCINENVKNVITSNSDFIEKEYDIITTILEGVKSDEYIGIKISAVNKETHLEELSFGMIIKDDIPYSLINFEVINSKVNDNVINLEIERPSFHDKVSSYVILYSYDNFFSPASTSYSKLIKLLQENKVPNNFEKAKIPIDAKSSSAYYYSTPELGITDLNLIVTNNEGFEEIDNTYKKRIKLYQTYQSASKRYELFTNRPVYVFVFATDKNYNYYVEDKIIEKIQSITPQSQYGPKSLNKIANTNDVLSQISLSEYENTFLLMIKDYNDPRFDHYDMYITPKGGNLAEHCEQSLPEQCYFFNGKDKLVKPSGFTYLVSSDATLTNAQNFDAIIPLSNFKLENDKEYDIYIIPVDSSGKGTIQLTKTSQTLKEVNSEYFILENIAQNMEPFKQTIKIIDKKAPNPMTSITVNPVLNNLNNELYLQWSPLNSENINKIDVKISKYNGEELLSQEIIMISIDGKIPNSNPAYFTKMIVENILPIDSAENKALNPPQTHSAVYSNLE